MQGIQIGSQDDRKQRKPLVGPVGFFDVVPLWAQSLKKRSATYLFFQLLASLSFFIKQGRVSPCSSPVIFCSR